MVKEITRRGLLDDDDYEMVPITVGAVGNCSLRPDRRLRRRAQHRSTDRSTDRATDGSTDRATDGSTDRSTEQSTRDRFHFPVR